MGQFCNINEKDLLLTDTDYAESHKEFFFRLDHQTFAAVLSYLIGNSANAVFML